MMIVFFVQKSNTEKNDDEKTIGSILRKYVLLSSAMLTALGTYIVINNGYVDLAEKTSPEIVFSVIGGPGKSELGLVAENIGAGKGIIQASRIRTRSNKVLGNNQFEIQSEFDLPSGKFNMDFLLPGKAVKPGEKIWLFKGVKNNKPLMDKLIPMLDNISIETCICSLSGHCQTKISGIQYQPDLLCKNKNINSRINYGIKEFFRQIFG